MKQMNIILVIAGVIILGGLSWHAHQQAQLQAELKRAFCSLPAAERAQLAHQVADAAVAVVLRMAEAEPVPSPLDPAQARLKVSRAINTLLAETTEATVKGPAWRDWFLLIIGLGACVCALLALSGYLVRYRSRQQHSEVFDARG